MLTIIGGSNIDYLSKSTNKMIMKDSNIGKIDISFGGVARNIAFNAGLLGAKINFISAIGDDFLGCALTKELNDNDINVINLASPNSKSSSYLAVHDSSGEMITAINDMDIIKQITIDKIRQYDSFLKQSSYIFIDTNLDEDVINYMVNNYDNVCIDTISVSKAYKVKQALSNIYLLKVNELEYESLKEELKINAPKYLLVTRGKSNVSLYHEGKELTYPVITKENVVNVTGVGDAMMGCIIYLLDKGIKMEDAIPSGIKASYYTLDVNGPVNKNIKNLLNL